MLVLSIFCCGAGPCESSPYIWSKFRSNNSNSGFAPDSNLQGQRLWNVTTGGQIHSSPSIGPDGTVYVGSGDGKLYAVDSGGNVKWTFPTGDAVNSSPDVYNGVVYFGSNDHKVYAVNATTGSEVWEFATGDAVYSSPLATSTLVYVGSNDANFYALDTATGARKWYVPATGPVQSPAVPPTGGAFFTTLNHEVYRVDDTTGDFQWRFLTGGENLASPAIGADGTVYVPSDDGILYALDGNTGQPRWTFSSGNSVGNSSSAAAVFWGTPSNDRIFFGNSNGFFAVDAGTQAALWTNTEWAGGGYVSSPAVVRQGVLYAGSFTGADVTSRLAAADTATGALKWTFLATGLFSSPAVGPDGKVYVGNSDGNLYAIQ
jgi:outer membrane protein assembly factor BamB